MHNFYNFSFKNYVSVFFNSILAYEKQQLYK